MDQKKKKKRKKQGRGIWCARAEVRVSIFKRVVREALIEKVIFEEGHEEGEEAMGIAI